MASVDEVESSPFVTRAEQPRQAQVDAVLGPSAALWTAVREAIGAKHGPTTFEWRFHSARTGWTLKVLRGSRNLFFFTPLRGRFRLGFVFGQAAAAAVAASDLPEDLKTSLAQATKNTEGRGLRLEIASPEQLATALKLVEIKLAH